MRVYRLRTYGLPDVGDHLIRFTGRIGTRMDVGPPTMMSADERLMQILGQTLRQLAANHGRSSVIHTLRGR